MRNSAAGIRSRLAVLLGVVGLVGMVGLAGLATHGATVVPVARTAALASILVDETFKNATAPDFIAVGTACLTGAPADPQAAPVGPHPLGGCPPVPPVPRPEPPTDAAPMGYLQLTEARPDQAGAVLHNMPIPSRQGVEISFEQWQEGSTAAPPIGGAGGADGISFFLVDGAATLDAPGAFGGSLGYAQKLPDDDPAMTFLPGVNHGFLGIGLDALGNYFGDWEHRGNGCEQRSPAGTGIHVPPPGTNMVTVRGPGHGIIGYCFLTATTTNFSTTGPWPSTLPGKLRGPLVTLPASPTPAEAEALLEPSRRTVTIRITPAPNPWVTVAVDFNDGNGSQQVLSFAAPTPVPATYKFGFGGSTGLWNDVHLIRNVRFISVDPLPALNLVKQVDIDTPLPDPLRVGDTIPYQYTLTNSGGTELTDLTVTDSKVTDITCISTSLQPDETTVCTGSYVVTKDDVIAGEVTNVATATGNGPDGPVTSPEDTVTVPIGGEVGLRLVKAADQDTPYEPGETATYTYTVTNLTDSEVTDLEIVDDRLTDVVCESTVLAPAGATGDSTVCTTSYLIPLDAQPGLITNEAVALGNGGALRSEPDDATIEIIAVPPTTTTPTTPTTPTPTPTPTEPTPTETTQTTPAGPTPQGKPPRPLATTGVAPGPYALVGLALVAAGLVLWTSARRSQRR